MPSEILTLLCGIPLNNVSLAAKASAKWLLMFVFGYYDMDVKINMFTINFGFIHIYIFREAFQNLYNNVSGSMDYWSQFWQTVATKIGKQNENILGYV